MRLKTNIPSTYTPIQVLPYPFDVHSGVKEVVTVQPYKLTNRYSLRETLHNGILETIDVHLDRHSSNVFILRVNRRLFDREEAKAIRQRDPGERIRFRTASRYTHEFRFISTCD